MQWVCNFLLGDIWLAIVIAIIVVSVVTLAWFMREVAGPRCVFRALASNLCLA